jgi:glutamate 5-kinase
MSQLIVVKIGTSTLTGGTPRLSRPNMLDIIRQLAHLHETGCRLVLVSSGAMAAGRELLDNPKLPNHLPAKQMLSAVGQGYLMQVYSTLFGHYDVKIGQVLLTHADLKNRTGYINARNTMSTMLDFSIVPIVNENDTIAVEEIKVGDNDNLSAHIAALLDADKLILLTDQDGLFDSDPRSNTGANLITRVEHIDENIWQLGGESVSGQGTGGMLTKLQAAQLATRGGTRTIIANGKTPDVLLRIMAGESLGTTFEPVTTQLESRKRWLLAEHPVGRLIIDDGAATVLIREGASLLPVGITAIQGEFERGALVSINNLHGETLAQGLSNYNNSELERIAGQHSDTIIEILGYTYGSAAVHRDHMVLIGR